MSECVCVWGMYVCVCVSVFVHVYKLRNVNSKCVFILGNVSKVLPDYEKSHVMSLIVSYIPENSVDDSNNLKYVHIYMCM